MDKVARELLKLAKELVAAEMYQLYYSTGGHSGPYKSKKEAEMWAKRYLSGEKRMQTVEIRPYSSDYVGGFKGANRGSKYIHKRDLKAAGGPVSKVVDGMDAAFGLLLLADS